MSEEIDRRVVEMQFRNEDFERNATRTMSTLDKLKVALRFDGASEGIEAVAAKFSALQVVGTTALVNLTNTAIDTGKKIVNALAIEPITTGFSEYELKMNSMRTIISSTGESIETVNKYLDELNEYSDKTIYSFSDMTQNIGKFTNAGVKLEDAVMAIKGISNEAAVSGANANEASRAMYNFAQALSSGAVKLIDWKSIENANMATMEFKEQLISTAVELGTLTKEGDKYISTTTDATGKVSDAFTATSMFNESLSSQWMTTDVLIKTLKNYADETTEIGKKAYEAAGEVTTFSKMCDTLKETAQSGWAKTWEIIFGDLETAKNIFTPLTNTIGGLIDKMSDFRNNLLEGALSKSPLMTLADKLDSLKAEEGTVEGVTKSLAEMQDVVSRVWRGDYGTTQERWNLLDSEGYDSKVVQSMVNLGYQYSLTIDDINAAYEKYGKMAPMAIKATNGFTTSCAMSAKALAEQIGVTEEEAEQLIELEEQASKTGKTVRELIEELDKPSGRELLVDSLKNIGESLLNVFGALKDAWIDAFPPPTSTQIYNLIDGIHSFTERIKITDEQADKLCRVFKGLFAIIDLVATVVGGPLKIAFKIITKVLEYFNLDMLDVVAGIADGIVAFRDWVDSIIDFDKVAQTIGQTIEKIAGYVQTWWDGFAKAPDKFKYVADSMSAIAKAVVDSISKWFESLRNSDTLVGNIIRGFTNGLADGISAIVEAAKNIVTKFVDTVKNLLGIHSPSTVFFDIGKNIIQGLLNGLSWLVSNVVTAAQNIVNSIIGVFNNPDAPKVDFSGITDFVTELINGLKTVVQNVLGNVNWGNILAAGIVGGITMTAVNLSKALKNLTSPLSSIKGCFNQLADTIEMLGKTIKGYINAKKFEAYGQAFKSFATGLIILAGAMWVLSTIDEDALYRGINTLATLSALIIVMAFVFSKLSGIQPLKALPVIITLSTLLTKLASIMLLCSLLSPEKFEQGMSAVGAFSGLISVLMWSTKFIDNRGALTAAKLFKSVASTIIAMTAAMRICGGMKDDDFAKGLIAVGAFSLLIAGLMLATKLMTAKDVASALATFGSIGTCLLLMAIACKIAGSMSITEAATGIIVITAMTILIALLMVCVRFLGGGQNTIGPTLLALSASLLIMAVACKIAGSMSTEAVANGIMAMSMMTIMVGILMLMTKFLGSDNKCGGTILAISIAIAILAGTCILMGMIEPEQMTRGLIAVGILSQFLYDVCKSAKNVGKGAATIIAIGVCVAILAAVAVVLGLVPIEQMAKGVLALDAMMFGLAKVIKSANTLVNNKGTIIALAVTIAVLAGSVYLLSTIETAAALVSTACMILLLTDFAVCMKIIGKMGKVSGKTIATIAVMTGVAAALATIIAILSNCGNPDTAIEMTACLVVMLTDLSACVAILSKSKNVNNKALIALGAMTLVVAALAGILVVLDEFDVEADIETVGSLAILLESLVGAVFIISKCKNVDPASALNVILVIGEIIAAMEVVFLAMAGLRAGIDAIFGDGSYESTIESGIDALNQLGRGIGEFIGNLLGGIAGGAASGFAKSLPDIGESLSKFMDKAQGFFDGLGKIPENALDAAVTVAGAIAAIAAGDMVSSFFACFTGSSSLENFSKGVVKLGEALISFYESIKSLDDDAVKKIGICADAAKGIAEMAKSIPNDGGLLGAIFGENNLAKWAPGLSVLGINLKGFALSIRDLTDDDVSKMQICTDVTKGIAEMAKAIPNEGGWLGAVFGENSLSVWAPQLPTLGENLSEFAESIRGITNDDAEKMESCTNIARGLANMADAIPNEGGWLGAIVGENSLGAWAPEIVALGESLVEFSGKINGLSEDDAKKMDSVVSIANGLVEMSNNIPNEGGMVSWFAGDNSITTWGEHLPEFGTYIKDFVTNTEGMGKGYGAVRAVEIARRLVEATKDIPETGGLAQLFAGTKDVGWWAERLPDFGKGVTGFSDEVQGIKDVKNLETIVNITKTLASLSEYAPKIGGWTELWEGTTDMTKLGEGFGALGSGLRSFAVAINGSAAIDTTVGPKLQNATSSAIDFTSANLNSAVNIASALAEIYQKVGSTNTLQYLVDWFVNGGDKISVFSASLGTLGTALGNFVISFFYTGAGAYTGQNGKTSEILSVVDVVNGVCETISSDASSDKIYNATLSLTNFVDAVSYFYQQMSDILGSDNSVISNVKDATNLISNFVKTFDHSAAGKNADALKKLCEVVTGFDNIKEDDVKSFVNAITSLASLDSQETNAAAFQQLYSDMNGVGSKIMSAITEGVQNNWATLKNGLSSSFVTVREKLMTVYKKFNACGSKIISAICVGVSNNWIILKNSINTSVTKAINGVNSDKYDAFKTLGKQMMQGFADGMLAKKEDVSAAASSVAQAAVTATKTTLDVHSPSRVLRGIGEYAGMGFVVGLSAYKNASYATGASVADYATSGLSEAITQIQRIMNSNTEWQPTITPVLDLSNIQNGAMTMQSMLSGASVSADSANSISLSMNSRNPGASNTDIVKAIKDLNTRLDGIQQNVYNVNGVTYDDGTNVASAVGQLVDAMQIRRRV